MTILTKTTRRKFYGKWLYKVTLNVPGATLLTVHDRSYIDDFLNHPGPTRDSFYNSWRTKAWNSRHTFKELLDTLDQYDDNEWGKRIESSWLDIYTNNESLYNDLSNSFGSSIIHRFEPSETTKDKLDNGKTMVVKKLPHDRFNYRVYLLPHNLPDRESKSQFLDWLENQKPRLTCTDSIKKWFVKTSVNWDRRYILVEDEGTLLLLKLKNPDVVGTVYKFEIE